MAGRIRQLRQNVSCTSLNNEFYIHACFQERWFQMVIRSVQANDFGDYICEGANQHGAGTATINLFGKEKLY